MRERTTIPGFEKTFPRILQQVDDAIIESKTPDVIANHYIGANRRFDTIGEAANQLDLAQQPSATKRLARHLEHRSRINSDYPRSPA